jgi:hypothetical protein
VRGLLVVGIGKLARLTVPEVRVRVYIELDRSDGRVPLQQGSHDAVHTIHYSPINSENDRVGQIDGLNKAYVLGYVTHRELGPVRRVQLPDGLDRHLLRREVAAQFDEPIHIPRIKAILTRPKVVLLPHRCI